MISIHIRIHISIRINIHPLTIILTTITIWMSVGGNWRRLFKLNQYIHRLLIITITIFIATIIKRIITMTITMTITKTLIK